MPGGDLPLSIVIPTLNEEVGLAALLQDLRRLTVEREIVVTDGGSTDGTVALARTAGARVVRASRGRGAQLRVGAAAARGTLLCFLHGDVRLDGAAARRLDALAREPAADAWAFRLRIDSPGATYRIIELGAQLRSRFGGLPYGDQGLIVRRDLYDRVGGYPPHPLMEDVALVRALGRVARVRILEESLTVSARRWRRDGPLRRILRNWILVARYLAGTPPERLAPSYRPEPSADG
jgi:rSAM/selenodomain-associated transferase 2